MGRQVTMCNKYLLKFDNGNELQSCKCIDDPLHNVPNMDLVSALCKVVSSVKEENEQIRQSHVSVDSVRCLLDRIHELESAVLK